MTRKPTMRRTTSAEKLAGRLWGEEVPEEVAVEVPVPAGVQLAARVKAPEVSAKPDGMTAAAWHASRYEAAGEDDGPDAA
ncbi:MAG: hypothetical protein JWO67_1947 [Streptosporangiaceae bacterium]|nr:hypothetical protein [Streptosporangiaceae bacterium]